MQEFIAISIEQVSEKVSRVSILKEGQVNDVAAYTWVTTEDVTSGQSLLALAYKTTLYGLKMTERMAVEKFTIPEGKHYRR